MKSTIHFSWAYQLLLALSLALYTLASSVCYFPNERSADYSAEYGSAYQPCPASNDGISMCCALNRTNPPGGNSSEGLTRDTCLRNGLYENSQDSRKTTTYWRDLCTSTDWSDKGKCLNVCTEDDTGTTPQLTPCDGTATSETWCCVANKTDCCNTTSAITIAAVFGASSSSTPTSTANHTSGSSGLSTGAKAGVGVGAGVGALLVISALVGLLLRSRKKKRLVLGDNTQYNLAPNTDMAYGVDPRRPMPELGVNTIHEASAGGYEPKNNVNHNARYELPENMSGNREIGGY